MRARLLAAVLGFAACGCAADDQYPRSPYFEECAADADCAPYYQCLPWTGWPGYLGRTEPPMFCTITCTTRDDCPPVISEHCGDQTWCKDAVCGHSACR